MKGSLLLGALCALGAVASPLDKRVLVTDIDLTIITVTVTERPVHVTTSISDVSTTTVTSITTTVTAEDTDAGLKKDIPTSTSSLISTTSVVIPSSTSSSSSSSSTSTVVSEPTTTSSIVTSTAVSTTSTSSSATSTSTASSSYESIILDSHNIHRTNHSAPNLSWNETLAESALALANTCDYHHDSSLGPAAGYGQNIGFGIDADQVAELITNMMYNDEISYFNGLYGEANPDMTNFDKWGHFSQIVWLDTTSVGCATVTCSPLADSGSSLSLPFTVCNYYPAGNYAGEYGDNVLEPLGEPTVTAS